MATRRKSAKPATNELKPGEVKTYGFGGTGQEAGASAWPSEADLNAQIAGESAVLTGGKTPETAQQTPEKASPGWAWSDSAVPAARTTTDRITPAAKDLLEHKGRLHPETEAAGHTVRLVDLVTVVIQSQRT